ncbi:Uu.00g019930.m01.CDS01 [Anthostomella pinea]|uniref:Uu.00g019930.m01.CDS01 n=1 Tax=Anthostomella pinea TaxID=933095 RepID=A0AAI8W010_9PEZI|nr:Uu.00g019930.m01.CDS01 [Anthostomella pinea]
MRSLNRFIFFLSTLSVGHTLQTQSQLGFCAWNPRSSLLGHHACSITDETHLSSGEGLEGNASQGYPPNEVNEAVWSRRDDCIDKYCIWVNQGFFERGIAVVTTAQNYQQIKHLPSSATDTKDNNDRFSFVDVPGRGKGLVANKAIRRGEPIVAAKPALLVHRGLFEDLSPEDLYELLDMAVDSLPKTGRESYMAQAGEMGGHLATNILFTNSYQINLGEPDGFHYGTYPDVSRLNHDCRPNLAFYIDQNLTHHTRAVRDIKPGEELTVSYIDPLQVRIARQERLRNTLGFSCGCSQCSLPKSEADASDARLLSIQEIESELSDFNSQAASPAMIERLMTLYEEERLVFNMAGAYTFAALNHNLSGRAEMAQKYARMAVEADILEEGPHSSDVQSMQILASNPKGHWSFNLKPGRCTLSSLLSSFQLALTH